MGEKIDSLFFQRNPEFLEDLKEPFSSVEAKEIFELIKENPYTINRGVGMGTDIIISPDMVRICQIGEREGIDLYPYKEFFKLYVYKQRESEQKQKEIEEKKAKGKQ